MCDLALHIVGKELICELESDDVFTYGSNVEVWLCSKIDFPCYIHLITLEKHLLTSYEVFFLRELIVESKRLPKNKVIQFDNVWFVMDASPWSWLKAKNITANEVQVWII